MTRTSSRDTSESALAEFRYERTSVFHLCHCGAGMFYPSKQRQYGQMQLSEILYYTKMIRRMRVDPSQKKRRVRLKELQS